MIKQSLKDEIVKLEQLKTQELMTIEKSVREKDVVPFNARIDVMLSKAISEEQAKLNTQIEALAKAFDENKAALIKDFEARKKEFYEQALAKKQDNERSTVAAAINLAGYKYDLVIKKINEIIADTEE